MTGTWTNSSAFPTEYDFRDNGTVYFAQAGFSSMMKYHLDESKNPIWIDFETTRGKNTVVIPGLMKIIQQDTIIIEQFSPTSNHPTWFTPAEEQSNNKHSFLRKK